MSVIFLKLNKFECGFASIMMLLVVMVLLVIGSGLMISSKMDGEIMNNYVDGISAQYLAEAGIQHIRAEVIVQKYNENIDNSKLRNISLQNMSMGNGYYDVTAKSKDGIYYTVTSTGRVNHSSRKLEAIMKMDPLLPGEEGVQLIKYINKLQEQK